MNECPVYPRVGGGNRCRVSASVSASGLSPRGRGKPHDAHIVGNDGRSIPAWAGETGRGFGFRCRRRVYPRVGGGNRHARTRRKRKRGLSPRGRGKRSAGLNIGHQWGSIPAWAGETALVCPAKAGLKVYPRVGGGNVPFEYITWDGRRSIPAWAGETAYDALISYPAKVYPRVGGGNFIHAASPQMMRGLSPRGRGKRVAAQ